MYTVVQANTREVLYNTVYTMVQYAGGEMLYTTSVTMIQANTREVLYNTSVHNGANCHYREILYTTSVHNVGWKLAQLSMQVYGKMYNKCTHRLLLMYTNYISCTHKQQVTQYMYMDNSQCCSQRNS